MKRCMHGHVMVSVFWLTPVCVCRPGQRTGDDLEIIYDELLHIKALAHLSNTVSQLQYSSLKATELVLKKALNAPGRLASLVFVFKTRGRNCHCQQSSYQRSGTRSYTQSVSCWQVFLVWRSLLVCIDCTSVCCCFHASYRESGQTNQSHSDHYTQSHAVAKRVYLLPSGKRRLREQ